MTRAVVGITQFVWSCWNEWPPISAGGRGEEVAKNELTVGDMDIMTNENGLCSTTAWLSVCVLMVGAVESQYQ